MGESFLTDRPKISLHAARVKSSNLIISLKKCTIMDLMIYDRYIFVWIISVKARSGARNRFNLGRLVNTNFIKLILLTPYRKSW